MVIVERGGHRITDDRVTIGRVGPNNYQAHFDGEYIGTFDGVLSAVTCSKQWLKERTARRKQEEAAALRKQNEELREEELRSDEAFLGRVARSLNLSPEDLDEFIAVVGRKLKRDAE